MSKFTYINAGIGATDSEFAAARVGEDVLSHKPDFVLMEFAVNDGRNEHYTETYEGTVRQILGAERGKTGLLLMCNVFYNDGGSAEEIHRQVARHYLLPVVSMRSTIYEALQKGDIPTHDEITQDDLHPNDAGHELVANVIIFYLEGLLEEVRQERNHGMDASVKEYNSDGLPEPLTDNRYEVSVRYDNRNSASAGVLFSSKGFLPDMSERAGVSDCFKGGYIAREKGSYMEYEVSGCSIAVQYRRTVNCPAPVARVVVDGDIENGIILDGNFDQEWGDYLALEDIYISKTNALHRVRIEIVESHPEDKSGFYLASVIVSFNP